MSSPAARIAEFVDYVHRHITGDEKGEAQLFCDRLFRAFGHEGIREAGGTLEYRVHQGRGTKFADLLWRPRLLLEMKKRGETAGTALPPGFRILAAPRAQPARIRDPLQFRRVLDLRPRTNSSTNRWIGSASTELPDRYTALNFLFPDRRQPLFNNNRVAVTRVAADKVAQVFNLLVERGRAGGTGPNGSCSNASCACSPRASTCCPAGCSPNCCMIASAASNSRALLGRRCSGRWTAGHPAAVARFANVPYFNGGLFSRASPVALDGAEIELLLEAAAENWAKVQVPIFGTLFEGSMDKKDRHAFGAHFTSEADIQKVVLPTIVRPWRERIRSARSARDLLKLRQELLHFRVLDPACGSGNFLYVAYRELKRVEVELLNKIWQNFGRQTRAATGRASLVGAGQFFGIDIKPFRGRTGQGHADARQKAGPGRKPSGAWPAARQHLPFDVTERTLPLDNLDSNIRCDDALFCDWPRGGRDHRQPALPVQEQDAAGVRPGVRAQGPGAYPRRSPAGRTTASTGSAGPTTNLPIGGRAGLVGTNTIRQNYSREGGLDYIVANGGTITEAVSTQVWPGEAAVHVSIVNWIKGKATGKKKLFVQKGNSVDSPWEVHELSSINSSLSAATDVSDAARLTTNMESGGVRRVRRMDTKGFF